MTFDKSKVYTALNADELEVGSNVILANYLEFLQAQVKVNSWPTYVKRLDGVMGTSSTNRFKSGDQYYNLAYLVRRPGEAEPEEEKWIVYLAKEQDFSRHLDYCAESFWAWGDAKPKLFVGTYEEAKEWCQSRQKFLQVIKAWEDGKQIQYWDKQRGYWFNVNEPSWNRDKEYRVKPENKKLSEKVFKSWKAFKYDADKDSYVVYIDHYGKPRLDFGSCAQWDKIQEYKGAKNKLFIGTKQQCEEWCDSHDKFAKEILAWEDGEGIQYRETSLNKWIDCDPLWYVNTEYRVKPNGLVWTDLKMGDILRRAGERPAPLGGKHEYVHIEERRMVTGIVDDPGTKRHVQLGGDWIDDDDLEKWSVEE